MSHGIYLADTVIGKKYDFLVLFAKSRNRGDSSKHVRIRKNKNTSRQHVAMWKIKRRLVFQSRQLLVGTTHLYVFIFV